MIYSGVSNVITPVLMGITDLLFIRLNIIALVITLGMINDICLLVYLLGIGTLLGIGWTLYTPLSTLIGDIWSIMGLLGILLLTLGVASTFTALNIIVSYVNG